ncbi:MAG: hypothetical protein DRO09_01725 [Thermoprotei archaeon]|nr:MAG: hypothetical protein DRO09_01725 [Thermoprotei archaeon]
MSRVVRRLKHLDEEEEIPPTWMTPGYFAWARPRDLMEGGGEEVTEVTPEVPTAPVYPTTAPTTTVVTGVTAVTGAPTVAPGIISPEAIRGAGEALRNVSDSVVGASGPWVYAPIENIVNLAGQSREMASALMEMIRGFERTYSDIARAITELAKEGGGVTETLLLMQLTEMRDMYERVLSEVRSYIDAATANFQRAIENLMVTLQRRPEEMEGILQAISNLQRAVEELRRPSLAEQVLPWAVLGVVGFAVVYLVVSR